MIYFITNGKSVKIGYTKNNIERRLKQLQTSCPQKLFILGWIDGDKEKEKELHIQFSNSRIRSNGEWFNPTEDLLDYINKNNKKENTYVDFVDGVLISLLKIKKIII